MSGNASIHGVDNTSTLDNGKVKWIPVKVDANGAILVNNEGPVLTQADGTKKQVVFTDPLETETSLGMILTELKVMNLHLAILTENIVSKEDIE